MDPITAKLMSAAGAALGDPIYVDDVFSTFTYRGNGTARTITNGIDLSGEGGAVWIKHRESTNGHRLVDTVRGATESLEPHDTNAEATETNGLTAFTSSGFSIGTQSHFNENNNDFCSWTFRKCPKFFDIVIYTGDANNGRTISHNLASVPGSIWVKRLDGTDNWTVYHRGTDSTAPEDYALFLNTDVARSDQDLFADTAPTASVFSVGDNVKVNGNGNTYVAYLFGHDEQEFGTDRDEAIIKCGSYTGNGGTQSINVGFEPQYVLTKGTSATSDWFIHDIARKFTVKDTSESATLKGNKNHAEATNTARIHVNRTGFDFDNEGSGDVNANGTSYIYIAIRRPHKPTEDEDEVLDIKKVTGDGDSSRHIEGTSGSSPTDMHMVRRVSTNGEPGLIGTRLQGPFSFITNSNETETSNKYGGDGEKPFDVPTGVVVNNDAIMNSNNDVYMHYFFARKPEIFDCLSYDGTGSATTVAHSLGAVPELIIVKNRKNSNDWFIYHSALGADKHIKFNDNNGQFNATRWNSTSPTSSVFSLSNNSNVNGSGRKYMAWLFASKAGICKIGSYSGTGSSLDVDCGFRARFVIIKRADTSGNWWVLDSVHGINAGNDPGWNLNNNNTGTAQYDLIDTDSNGFTAPASRFDINQNGGTYIFMAFK